MSEIYLQEQKYGKDRVRLTKIIRDGNYHYVVELTVRVLLEGDFTESYTKADNTNVIATDSMKNTIYILAKKSNNVQYIELFGSEIGTHFLTKYPHVTKVNVWITKHRWTRILVEGELHDHSFWRDGDETRNTSVVTERGKDSQNVFTIESGLKDLLVLKTTGSGFSGFIRDEFTTLPETDDRILSTSIDATWTYNIDTSSASLSSIPFDEIFDSVRKITLEIFATDNSVSVQATLYLMAKRILEKHPQVKTTSYALPNKHHFAFNLEQFGLKNSGPDAEIFVPFNDPSGLITAKIGRTQL